MPPPIEARELRAVGLKATPSRLHVLKVLEESEQKHMSAEDVYRELIRLGVDIGYATIYRALTRFEAAGMVIRHNFDSGPAVFELAGEAHHDHMVCLQTGQVIEFQDEMIERQLREIAERHGYTLEEQSLVLYVRPRSGKTQP